MTMSIDIFNYIFKLAPLVHKATTTPPGTRSYESTVRVAVQVLKVECIHIFNYIFLKDDTICANLQFRHKQCSLDISDSISYKIWHHCIGAPSQSNPIIANAASTGRVAGSKNIGSKILQSAFNVFNDIFYLNWHRLCFKGPTIPDCSNQ